MVICLSTKVPQPTSQKKLVFNPWLAWHAKKKSWVILESKLLPWAEIDFSDFCLRIFKLDIFTVVAGWSLHFIADLRGFSPMCVLAFDPLMCHLVSCKLWTVKQQWKSGGKVAGEFVFSIVTPNTKTGFSFPCFSCFFFLVVKVTPARSSSIPFHPRILVQLHHKCFHTKPFV